MNTTLFFELGLYSFKKERQCEWGVSVIIETCIVELCAISVL